MTILSERLVMRLLFAGLFCALSLTACGSTLPFQPVPDSYLLWAKPGASQLEVKKALLECGMASPSSPARPPLDPRTPDQLAAAENCMQAAGFKAPQPSHRMCAAQPHLATCQADAAPSSRSVERRLSSNYCQAKKDVEFCRRTASNPSACEEGPVVPECLP